MRFLYLCLRIFAMCHLRLFLLIYFPLFSHVGEKPFIDLSPTRSLSKTLGCLGDEDEEQDYDCKCDYDADYLANQCPLGG